MRVLEHAMVRVDHVLKQLKDSISVQTPVIVCVLSDGWNRAFHGSADQSRYWRCRLEFSKCATLGQFKGWCNDYIRKFEASKFSNSTLIRPVPSSALRVSETETIQCLCRTTQLLLFTLARVVFDLT